MEIDTTDSEEIYQYNIAITRCHEINGNVKDILVLLKILQSKFTIPVTSETKIKARQGTNIYVDEIKRCSVQKNEKPTVIRCRSLHLISRMTNDFIVKCNQIKSDFEGSLSRLKTIRERHERNIRSFGTHERKSCCKCSSRDRKRNKN